MPRNAAWYRDDLAYIHHTGFADLARGAAPFVVEHLHMHGVERGRVLELGCGSGIVLQSLVRAGHTVTGVDMSPAMIKLARKAAPRATLSCMSLYDFVDDTIRKRSPLYDCILLLGEPLNYREPDGRAPPLAPFFRKLARLLRPGGTLLFDVIVDRPGPQLSQRGFMTGANWAVLVDTVEDNSREHLTRRMTTFTRSRRAWRRHDEVHEVRVLRARTLRDELRVAGFTVRTLTSWGSHRLAVRRRAFVCTRRAPR